MSCCLLKVESAELSSHTVEHLDKHFDVIFTKVAGVERALYGPERSRAAAAPTERSLTDRLADIEVNVRSLQEAAGTSTVGHVSNAVPIAPAAAAAGGSDVQSILVSTNDKMAIYEGVITVLNREVEKLSTQVSHRIHKLLINNSDSHVEVLTVKIQLFLLL